MSTPAFASASERNKQPIFEQLLRLLPAAASVLEIGSGWGQHAVYFAGHVPAWKWRPSEHPQALPELQSMLNTHDHGNIREALALDVLEGPWPEEQFDAVFSANTAHIMSWSEVCAMFDGVGLKLLPGGLFCLYGPFNVDGKFTAPSNEAFDTSLRSRDPLMGIRDLEALESLAGSHHMKLQERVPMPANNFLLVFKCDKPNRKGN